MTTIDGDSDVEKPCKFVRGMYLAVFYCLCYIKERSTDVLKEHVLEEKDADLNDEEDIKIEYSRGNHWRDVAEDSDGKSKIHALGWYVYTR